MIPIGHRFYDPLSYVLSILDGKDGCYQGVVMQYDTNSIPIVRDREGNLIGAGSGAQPLTVNHGGQPPQTIKAQMEEKKRLKKRAGMKEGSPNHGEVRIVAR